MNAELIKKEVAAICNRKITRLRKISEDTKFHQIIRKRATQEIYHLQDTRFRWCESTFLDRCQQRIKEELQEQHDCHWR